MRVGIVGGRLQGLEAVYLSREAGFETVLFDKDENVPARFMADEFHRLDLLRTGEQETSLFDDLDVLIPAVENHEVLLWLQTLGDRGTVPVALDLASYAITSSKIRSNALFDELGICFPRPWPECGFPAIVKPAVGSGSQGVHRVADESELEGALNTISGKTVIQELVSGPSYSLEVVADRGVCSCLQVTQLEVDPTFDCKRVTAGPNTGQSVDGAFRDIGKQIAHQLGLSGIMDIEVIARDGKLHVLEIDARLPSQTPTTVYHSTGLNTVALLAEYWNRGALPFSSWSPPTIRGVVYEHYQFQAGVLSVIGEHVLSNAPRLQCYSDRFSTECMITNFEAYPKSWVATAIYIGEDEDRAWEARDRGVREILGSFGATAFLDPHPDRPGGDPFDQTYR